MKALDLGSIETLIIYENLDTMRYVYKDGEDKEVVVEVNPNLPDKSYSIDKVTGQEMDLVSEQLLVEWLAENYKNYGANLEFISDKSTEGAQFVAGFGGIGAMLRYKVNFEQLLDESDDEFVDEGEIEYDFI